MRSLSSTVSETPSTWAPSRSVVSKTSTATGNALDMLDPVLVPVDLAPHRLAVLLHDGFGHRARARHLPVVDGVDGSDLGGGSSRPWRATKRFSPVHSETKPIGFSMMASSYPALIASTLANDELT